MLKLRFKKKILLIKCSLNKKQQYIKYSDNKFSLFVCTFLGDGTGLGSKEDDDGEETNIGLRLSREGEENDGKDCTLGGGGRGGGIFFGFKCP